MTLRCLQRMRFGAELQPGGGARFDLWAPAARSVELLLHEGAAIHGIPAQARGDGWYGVEQADAAAGQAYQWRIDGDLIVPDPASRQNPHGPHGPSVLVDPLDFEWEDWPGRPWHEAVCYQVHIGCFTPEGTFAAAAERLPALAQLGITAVQLMPLADFPGEFGWGYDGVLPFAPYHGYGTPQDLKRFVRAAHRLGLMVLGDVVYNHFGPDGNYLHAYAPQFFSEQHRNPWGPALNFDGPGSATVREFVIANALYWLNEYRFDGLRLDAVHAMPDTSAEPIVEALSRRVRAECAGRDVHLVLENDSNDVTRLAAPGTPGRYDAQWNGDVHHTLHVQLTGEQEGYYAEYPQPVPQLARCLSRGFARQGGPHNAEGAPPRRDAEGDAPLGAIVNFLQNHDQIGNRAFGDRLQTLADPAALRLAAAIVLLAPTVPMLFMGEEWGATQPFLYVADWQGELREAVQRGRVQEFAHFARYAEAARTGDLPDPCSRASFERCKLPATPPDDAVARGWLAFYAQLLATRTTQLMPQLPHLSGPHEAQHDGAWLQLRWRFGAHRVLQMQANLSDQAVASPAVDGDLMHAIGDTNGDTHGDQLGAWSGRWHWLHA